MMGRIVDVIQGTPEWYAARSGIPTASEFSQLVTSTGERSKSLAGYAVKLAAEVLAGPSEHGFAGNSATARGKELEAEARAWYEFDQGVAIDDGTFWMADSGTAGASPDGLIGDEGGVEIKCPLAHNHLAAYLRFLDSGSPPPEYVAQVQGSLWVTGRKWWDLVLYHPAPMMPKWAWRIEPDAEFHAKLADAVLAVIAERDRIVTLVNGG